MDPIKIENFESQYPGEFFPYFRQLSSKECLDIRNALIQKLKLSKDVSSLDLVNHIAETGQFIPNQNTESPDFNLTEVLKSQNIILNKNIFISWLNWSRFDIIDEIKVNDLSNHFDDVWYPAADDIAIFDTSLDWILIVYHYGGISLKLLN